MAKTNESLRFVTDAAGNRIGVILDVDRYEELIEAFEELEDIHAFDEATASGDEAIPFEQAVEEIERARKFRAESRSSGAHRSSSSACPNEITSGSMMVSAIWPTIRGRLDVRS